MGVSKGAVMFSKPSERLTRSTKTKQVSNIYNVDEENEQRVAEIIADLFFGGESCEYLKSLKNSNRGRFVPSYVDNKRESWFDGRCSGREGCSFEVLWSLVEIWFKMTEKICDIELVKQVVMNNLKKSKLIEEDNCVICYSKIPSITFFPCGHKIFCEDCHKLGRENYREKGCACCRQKISFYKKDDAKPKATTPKKTVEFAQKLTKMTLRKR